VTCLSVYACTYRTLTLRNPALLMCFSTTTGATAWVCPLRATMCENACILPGILAHSCFGAQSYRPLTVLSFRWTYWLFGPNVFFFHLGCVRWRELNHQSFNISPVLLIVHSMFAGLLTDILTLFRVLAGFRNVIVNAIVAVKLEQCLKHITAQIDGCKHVSFAAALLFTSHPVHTEAVAGMPATS
jgi:hypothetical protein